MCMRIFKPCLGCRLSSSRRYCIFSITYTMDIQDKNGTNFYIDHAYFWSRTTCSRPSIVLFWLSVRETGIAFKILQVLLTQVTPNLESRSHSLWCCVSLSSEMSLLTSKDTTDLYADMNASSSPFRRFSCIAISLANSREHIKSPSQVKASLGTQIKSRL